MVWKLAADFIVLLHLLWILFLIFGALIGRKIVWVKWIHLAGLAFSVALQIFNWVCPLTYLERWLLLQAEGSHAYTGDFISRIIYGLVYIHVSPVVIFLSTLLIVALSLWAYFSDRFSR